MRRHSPWIQERSVVVSLSAVTPLLWESQHRSCKGAAQKMKPEKVTKREHRALVQLKP